MTKAELSEVAIEDEPDGQLVLRLVTVMAPISTDEIAAAGAFEGRGRLLPDAIVCLLARRGFVTRRLLPGSRVRDVYVVNPTARGEAWAEAALKEYVNDYP